MLSCDLHVFLLLLFSDCLNQYFSILKKTDPRLCPICKSRIKNNNYEIDKKLSSICEIVKNSEKLKAIEKSNSKLSKYEKWISDKNDIYSPESLNSFKICVSAVPFHIIDEVKKFKKTFDSSYKIQILNQTDLKGCTHLVVSPDENNNCIRTIKYLKALTKGIWIVSYNCN